MIRIARLDGDKYLFLDDPDSVIERLRQCGTRIDLFTFMQKLSEPTPKYPYPMEWDNLAALPVSTFETWWAKQVDKKTRNMVRRAEKNGVKTREVPFDEVLVRGISDIYNECPVRQGRRFAHYGKGIERVRQENATFLDNSIFVGSFLDNKLIGFVKLTCDQARTQAGLMQIVSMIQHRDKATTNALIAQAVRSCAERNIPYLVYSNFTYGKKLGDSLSEFKERNGFRRVDLPRYYVPLTHVGSAAFRLGLHRRLIEHLPDTVVAPLRALRSAWHSRHFSAVTEA